MRISAIDRMARPLAMVSTTQGVVYVTFEKDKNDNLYLSVETDDRTMRVPVDPETRLQIVGG